MSVYHPDPTLSDEENVRAMVTEFLARPNVDPTIGVPKAPPAVLRVAVRAEEGGDDVRLLQHAIGVTSKLMTLLKADGRVKLHGYRIAAELDTDVDPDDLHQLELLSWPLPGDQCVGGRDDEDVSRDDAV